MSFPGEVTELLRELIRIPSVNPDGDPGTDQTGEAACAEYVGDFLEQCGAAVEYQEVHPGRPNVIGRFQEKPGAPRLILAPHLDTVSVLGMTIDPFAAERRDGRIYGRGASDTKGTMAAMLMALAEMKDRLARLEHEVWFVGLMGEEAGQDGARAFVAEHRADFALIGEPTNLDVVYTHKGGLWMQLATTGHAAHASTPEDGRNAIYEMLEVLAWLRKVVEPEFADFADPVLGLPTLSVGTLAGGSKVNIVPDHCRAGIDIRTTPALAATGFGDTITARLRERFPQLECESWESRPLVTPPDHPMIQRLVQGGARCVGAPWFCDAAVFCEAGIPAVAAGPGSIAQAHTKDEWVAEQDLRHGVAFYRQFLERC